MGHARVLSGLGSKGWVRRGVVGEGGAGSGEDAWQVKESVRVLGALWLGVVAAVVAAVVMLVES